MINNIKIRIKYHIDNIKFCIKANKGCFCLILILFIIGTGIAIPFSIKNDIINTTNIIHQIAVNDFHFFTTLFKFLLFVVIGDVVFFIGYKNKFLHYISYLYILFLGYSFGSTAVGIVNISILSGILSIIIFIIPSYLGALLALFYYIIILHRIIPYCKAGIASSVFNRIMKVSGCFLGIYFIYIFILIVIIPLIIGIFL